MRTDSWTAERIELLRKLWAQGETAATIATRLGGLSRSAVLGKIFRLRLDTAAAKPSKQSGKTAKTKRPGSRAKAAGTASTARPSLTVADFLARRRRGARDEAMQNPPAAVSCHKTLFELTNNTCRSRAFRRHSPAAMTSSTSTARTTTSGTKRTWWKCAASETRSLRFGK